MDKIINRKIKLIQLLYSYRSGIKINELANLMGLTVKTVKSEIVELNEYLRKMDYGIQIANIKSNFFLEKKNILYIDKLFFEIEKKSNYFFFVNNIFNFNLNKNNLEYIYFNSESHFNCQKLKYARHLEKYDLKISNSPYSIIGDELVIRFYFYLFYWEKYGQFEWPFDSIVNNEIISLIEKIERHIKILLNSIERRKLAYWLAIVFKRVSNGKFLKSSKKIEKNINYKKDNSFYRLIIQSFKDISIVDHKIAKNELTFIHSVLLLTLDEENLIELISNNKILSTPGDVLDCSLNFCEAVQSDFQLKPSINIKMILKCVYTEFYFVRVLSGNVKSNIKKYNSDENPKADKLFSEKYLNFISKLLNSKNLYDFYKKDVLLWSKLKSIVFQIIDLDSYTNTYTIQIKLKQGYLAEINLKESLKRLNYNFNYEITEENPLDLIITDIQFIENKSKIPKYIWNILDLESNLLNLKQFIDKEIPY